METNETYGSVGGSALQDARDPGYARVLGGIQLAQQTKDRVLMSQSIAEAHAQMEGLAKQVEELLERIAPVCQPCGPAEARGTEKAREPAPPASPIRGEFMKLRATAERISARISSVRYTIEI